MPKLDLPSIPKRQGSGYPEPFDKEPASRIRQRLGDGGGLTQFGVNLMQLPPGSWSSQRHWHSEEDEFVYVVSGEVVLITDNGEEVMRAGDCAAFPRNSPNGHHLINKSGTTAVCLEVGTRTARPIRPGEPDRLAARCALVLRDLESGKAAIRALPTGFVYEAGGAANWLTANVARDFILPSPIRTFATVGFGPQDRTLRTAIEPGGLECSQAPGIDRFFIGCTLRVYTSGENHETRRNQTSAPGVAGSDRSSGGRRGGHHYSPRKGGSEACRCTEDPQAVTVVGRVPAGNRPTQNTRSAIVA